MELLVAVPPLLFGAAAFSIGRWAPVAAVAVVSWGALLVAVFTSGGGEFGPWLFVGPWLALTAVSIAAAVVGAWLRVALDRDRALPTDLRAPRGHARSLALAVLAAAVIAAPVLLLVLWLIGFGFFGVVTGSEPTAERWAGYLLVSMAAGSLIVGLLLRNRVHAMTDHRLSPARALLTAFGALVPVHAAIAIITLTQAGNDEIVFVSAVMLAMGAAAICARWMSEPAARD